MCVMCMYLRVAGKCGCGCGCWCGCGCELLDRAPQSTAYSLHALLQGATLVWAYSQPCGLLQTNTA